MQNFPKQGADIFLKSAADSVRAAFSAIDRIGNEMKGASAPVAMMMFDRFERMLGEMTADIESVRRWFQSSKPRRMFVDRKLVVDAWLADASARCIALDPTEEKEQMRELIGLLPLPPPEILSVLHADFERETKKRKAETCVDEEDMSWLACAEDEQEEEEEEENDSGEDDMSWVSDHSEGDEEDEEEEEEKEKGKGKENDTP